MYDQLEQAKTSLLSMSKGLQDGTLKAPTTPPVATGTPPAPTVGGASGIVPPTGFNPTKFSVNVPTTVPTDALKGAPTAGQVSATYRPLAKQFEEYQATQRANQQALLGALKPTEQENQLTEQLRSLNQQARVETERSENRLAPTFAITGEQAAIERQRSIQAQGYASQLQALVDARSTQIDGLKTAMQFDQQNFEALVNLQKLTKPDVLSTQVNKETGDVTAFVQDADGNLTSQVIGNIGAEAQKPYTSTGTYSNDATGQQYFFGVTPDGQIETIALPGSAGLKPTAIKGSGGTSTKGTTQGGVEVDSEGQPLQKTQSVEFVKNAVQIGEATEKLINAVELYEGSIDKAGTRTMPIIGAKAAGDKAAARTQILLSLKNMEQTGALDKGTVDVLEPTIPKNTFWQTETYQRQILKNLKDNAIAQVKSKLATLEGTTAYNSPEIISLRNKLAKMEGSVPNDELEEIEGIINTRSSGSGFSPASYYGS